MSAKSTEEVLSGLGRSTESTVELLDTAAKVIGLQPVPRANAYAAVGNAASKSDVAAFREQWVLKWMLKRFAEDISATNDPRKTNLVRDGRFWSLLNHVLDAVPLHALQEILVEKNFCQSLGLSLMLVAEFLATTPLQQNNSYYCKSSDVPDDHPVKRRKLSTENSPDSPWDLLDQIIETMSRSVDVLSPKSDAFHIVPARSIKWVRNIEDATRFLTQMLSFSRFVLEQFPVDIARLKNSRKDVLTTAHHWLNLWSSYATSIGKASKQNLHLLFNENALVHSLSLLQSGLKSEFAPFFQSLERLVALHAILPAREAFQQHKSRIDKMGDAELLSKQVKLAAIEISKPLGSSIHALKPELGAQLIRIANRLVPRSDVPRRRSEAPWLEALFYTLTHQNFTSRNDKAMPVRQNPASKLDGDMPSTPDFVDKSTTPVGALDSLLDALEETEVEPTSDFWCQHIRDAVLPEEIDWKTLARIVKLNTSIFVPGLNDEGSQILKSIESRLSRGSVVNKEELDTIVSGILGPIIEATGKRRQLPAFVALWLEALSTTYRRNTLRHSDESGPTSNSHLWYDPELLKIFESTLQAYKPLALSRDLLRQVEQDLVEMTSEDTQFPDIFARITIVSAVIRPFFESAVGADALTLRAGVCQALQQQNGYNGQRWRLWRLLDLLVDVCPDEINSENLKDRQLPWLFFDESKSSGRPYSSQELLECYYCFCLVTSLHQTDAVINGDLFKLCLIGLNDLLCLYTSSQPSKSDMTTSWDGSADDMSNPHKLLSACIVRLSAMPLFWVQQPEHQELLVNILNIASSLPSKETEEAKIDPTLSDSAHSFLTSIYISTNEDIIDMFLRKAAKVNSGRTSSPIPGLLFQYMEQQINRGQAQKLTDTILRTMKSTLVREEAVFVDHLSVLAEIASSYPKAVGKHWSEFVGVLQRPSTDASLHQTAMAFDIIHKILAAVIKWNLLREPSQQLPALSAILDWSKTKIKEAKSIKKAEFFESYDSLLLLASVRLVRSIEADSHDSKLQKTAAKLEARFQKAALNIVHSLLRKDPDEKSCLLAWLSIVTLQLSKKDEQPEPEKSSPILEVTSKLHGYLAAFTKPAQPVLVNSGLLKGELDYLASTMTGLENPKISDNVVDGMEAIAADKAGGVLDSSVDVDETSNQIPTNRIRGLILKMLSTTTGESCVSKEVAPYVSLAHFIKSLNSEMLSTRPDLVAGLGKLAYLQAALKETSSAALIARLEISKIIFEQHPGVINQHIIDSNLKNVCLLASSSSTLTLSQTANIPQPNHIFDRLCTILISLLTRYRRRISGRYALLLPALQSLLKCLFYPPTRAHLNATSTTYASKAAFLASLPQWLNPHTHTSPTTLPAASATKFSRLLQTLCDPSVSSARRALKRPQPTSSSVANQNLNLVDETKLLRKQVSRHMQYFLQTYCQTVLDGYIAPEVRERLLPGLFAVLGATDIEVMRGLNAGMDESQRAIWRDLYAEWKGGR